MEKILLELSFRAILVHLLNQIFYLKKNQSDFCICEYWLYRQFKSFSEIKLNENGKFLYRSKGYCSNCEIIEKLGKLDFLPELYKLFISGKVEQLSKIGERVNSIQEMIERIIGYNFENDDLFKENVYLIDLVFDFNKETFQDLSFGLSAEEYIPHLKTIRERNEDGTKKFSDTFYFSNFWFGLLFWKKEYLNFDKVVKCIIKNDYKKGCLSFILF